VTGQSGHEVWPTSLSEFQSVSESQSQSQSVPHREMQAEQALGDPPHAAAPPANEAHTYAPGNAQDRSGEAARGHPAPGLIKVRALRLPVDLANRLALRPLEAAVALGVSERTLRSLLPRLPHVRIGGAVLIPLDPLRRWLEEQARETSARADAEAAAFLADLEKH
jgi:excisionase family DNA binding protein